MRIASIEISDDRLYLTSPLLPEFSCAVERLFG
jgi:hypothetical protein